MNLVPRARRFLVTGWLQIKPSGSGDENGAIARRRKAWFHLRLSKILFAAKHSWTILRMSRPLFVGSYLQVTWWALGQ